MTTSPPDNAGLADVMQRHGTVIGLAGWSGSGKTTLAEKLISLLSSQGLDVATVKHAHHDFDADTPGKDSYRHRAAGARQVAVSSAARAVLFAENRTRPERTLADLLAALEPADIVIVEGFKTSAIPKIEIHRAAANKPLLCTGDPQIIAVASDDFSALPDGAPPAIPLDDADAIAAFILASFEQRRAKEPQ